MLEYPGESLTFAADIMLYKLAKYLRALGYDTLFDEDIQDHELRTAAINENRVLLTRDKALCKTTPDLFSFYVKPQSAESQLRQVAKYYPVIYQPDQMMLRCLQCNTGLQSIPKDEIENRVHPNVFEYHNEFRYCASCEQVFWEGDHVHRLKKKLSRILNPHTSRS